MSNTCSTVSNYCAELACWQRAEECPLHAPSGVPPRLDVAQRPADVREAIQKAFDAIVNHTQSSWGSQNGNNPEGYSLCKLDDYALARALIAAHAGTQKEFVFLDIGAGNFQWGRGLASFLTQSGNLPERVSVRIISVRGERSRNTEVTNMGSCVIYELGAFKVEELSQQLYDRGFVDLENGVDLVVSHWCFRHLSDPVGTFVQTVNLLRPHTGWFLGDGFYHLRQGEEELGDTGVPNLYNRRMVQLLEDTGSHFLIRPYEEMRSMNQFALCRANDQPCRLPMSYRKAVPIKDNWQIGSCHVTQFDRATQPQDETCTLVRQFNRRCQYRTIIGGSHLYQWLKERNLFHDNDEMTWIPLYERDVVKGKALQLSSASTMAS